MTYDPVTDVLRHDKHRIDLSVRSEEIGKLLIQLDNMLKTIQIFANPQLLHYLLKAKKQAILDLTQLQADIEAEMRLIEGISAKHAQVAEKIGEQNV